MTQENALLNVKEVAGMLNIGVSTIWRHVNNGQMPKPIKIGGSVRWRQTDIDQWIADLEAA